MRIASLTRVLPFVAFSACSSTLSGLPEDLPMSDLTAEQAVTLCEATTKYQEENFTAQDAQALGCTVTGMTAGALAGEGYEEACTTAQSECLAGEPDPAEEKDCSDAAAEADDCAATVAQFEACLKESIDQMKSMTESFSCADGPGEPEESAGDETAEKSACEIYAEACGGAEG